MFILFIARWI